MPNKAAMNENDVKVGKAVNTNRPDYETMFIVVDDIMKSSIRENSKKKDASKGKS